MKASDLKDAWVRQRQLWAEVASYSSLSLAPTASSPHPVDWAELAAVCAHLKSFSLCSQIALELSTLPLTFPPHQVFTPLGPKP